MCKSPLSLPLLFGQSDAFSTQVLDQMRCLAPFFVGASTRRLLDSRFPEIIIAWMENVPGRMTMKSEDETGGELHVQVFFPSVGLFLCSLCSAFSCSLGTVP